MNSFWGITENTKKLRGHRESKYFFMVFSLVLIVFILFCQTSIAQYTHADTLRGSYGPGRTCWDLTKYDLHVKFNVNDGSISGYNIITFKSLDQQRYMQIDLQEPMILDSIKELNANGYPAMRRIFNKQGNAYFITFFENPGTVHSYKIYYHGKPITAARPPWDGGIVKQKDKNGFPWISFACQGLGASVWYPCKDSQQDEPDSAELNVTVPSNLVAVGNGRLRSKVINADGTSTYSWAVVSKINNYCIIPYIGKYVHFGEVYKGEKGNLDMDYWVLDYNLAKAKEHFKDATRMMKAFEHWFGPYPFYKDSYKLVEAPYVGMEHQSAIAYGNNYENGFTGRGDLSESGWGLKWDYMIVHESAHEWFGNSITSADIADMWVHESFATYSEVLFTEYYYGKKAALDYVTGLRKSIQNDVPVIGPFGVNKEGSSDMYYKGANMIHTIRQIINNDDKFRNILRGLNSTFYLEVVTGVEIQDFISKKAGIDLSKIFEQYLTTTMVPSLEYKIKNGQLMYRWTDCVKDFNMPVKVMLSRGNYTFIYPTENFKTIGTSLKDLKVDDNFYIYTRKAN